MVLNPTPNQTVVNYFEREFCSLGIKFMSLPEDCAGAIQACSTDENSLSMYKYLGVRLPEGGGGNKISRTELS